MGEGLLPPHGGCQIRYLPGAPKIGTASSIFIAQDRRHMGNWSCRVAQPACEVRAEMCPQSFTVLL